MTLLTFKRHPLLRNLVVIQILAIVVGITSIGIAYYMTSKSNLTSVVGNLREKVKAGLVDRHEKWRAWKQLGLEDALSEEMGSYRNLYPIRSINIVPFHNASKSDDLFQIFVPNRKELLSDNSVVSIVLDQAQIEATYLPKKASMWILFCSALLFIAVVLFSAFYIRRSIHLPILKLSQSFRKINQGADFDGSEIEASGEIRDFVDAVSKMYQQVKDHEKKAAILEVANQVAHDIKSPISALNMTIPTVAEIPEEKRLIIRTALSNINDTANNLLLGFDRKPIGEKTTVDLIAEERPSEAQLLSTLIQGQVSEKRMEYKNKKGVEIEYFIDEGQYALFGNVHPNEFKRVLSNIINNAVDAIPNNGIVQVTLKRIDDTAQIKIKDSGKGISKEDIPKLTQSGVSIDKANGSGLGLFHAKQCVDHWKGSLSIISKVGIGTTVTIQIPIAKAPEWFASTLYLDPKSTIAILDDDSTIHQVWKNRFQELNQSKITALTTKHFLEPAAFLKWAKRRMNKNDTYLCDYELIGHDQSGLDVIEELSIQANSLLVTSRFDDFDIQSRCKSQGIQIIPKQLGGFVPIEIRGNRTYYDAILIDDDDLIRMSWEDSAKEFGKRIRTFPTKKSFDDVSSRIDQSTFLFVDRHLGNDVDGLQYSQELSQKGFESVYLATGSSKRYIKPMPWLKGITEKDPPWVKPIEERRAL